LNVLLAKLGHCSFLANKTSQSIRIVSPTKHKNMRFQCICTESCLYRNNINANGVKHRLL